MGKLNAKYMIFYVNGRGETVLNDKDAIDVDDLADKVMDGADLHETIATVADSVAAPLAHDKKRKTWIAENREHIDEAGGDADEAYRHFVQGRKDQYAYALEADVVEAMFEEDDEDDDEEDDEDNDEDETPEGGA